MSFGTPKLISLLPLRSSRASESRYTTALQRTRPSERSSRTRDSPLRTPPVSRCVDIELAGGAREFEEAVDVGGHVGDAKGRANAVTSVADFEEGMRAR